MILDFAFLILDWAKPSRYPRSKHPFKSFSNPLIRVQLAEWRNSKSKILSRQPQLYKHPFKSFSNPLIRVQLAEWRNPKSKILSRQPIRNSKSKIQNLFFFVHKPPLSVKN